MKNKNENPRESRVIGLDKMLDLAERSLLKATQIQEQYPIDSKTYHEINNAYERFVISLRSQYQDAKDRLFEGYTHPDSLKQ